MQMYTLIRSKRRRRSAALKVTPQGEIVVRAPLFMPKFMIDRFVSSHSDWIVNQIKSIKNRTTPNKKYFELSSLEKFIKSKVQEYSQIIGLKPNSIKFRQVGSYWGSCSPLGDISFNSHLVYAPQEAVEYVIVHELCHLRYRGHGIRFWKMVEKYFPEYKSSKKVLRELGRNKLD